MSRQEDVARTTTGSGQLAQLVGDDACLARQDDPSASFEAVLWRLPGRRDTAFPPMPDHMVAYHLTGAGAHERIIDGQGMRRSGLARTCTIDPAGRASAWSMDEPCTALHFYIQPQRLAELASVATGHVQELPALDDPFGCDDPTIARLADVVVEEILQPTLSSRLFLNALEQALGLHLLRCYSSLRLDLRAPPDRRTARRVLPESRLRKVSEFVDHHIERTLTVEMMADVAGLSPFHFSRLFKAATGLPPHRFVMMRRIEWARTMIAGSDRPLADIALATGFSSQSHMTSAFKRLVGTSPGQLRRRSAGS